MLQIIRAWAIRRNYIKMENILKYYEFTPFFKDLSGVFAHNMVSYSQLNKNHFLIFEKNRSCYNLYISKYSSKKEVGKENPLALENVIADYSKSNPSHRIALKKYFQ